MLKVKCFTKVFLVTLCTASFSSIAADKAASAEALYQQAVIPWEQGRTSGWELMLKAADAGNVDAMCLVANGYMPSALVDSEKSIEYFTKSAKAGGLCGMLALSNIGSGPILTSSFQDTNGDQNWSEKLERIAKKNAAQDDITAIKMMAFIEGARGSESGFCKWMDKAANLGDADAMKQLSAAIRDGCGWYLIPGSRDKAVRHWTEQAANHGNPRAMEQMAVYAYEKNNYEEMLHWYDKAIDTGNENSLALVSSLLMDYKTLGDFRLPKKYHDKVKAYALNYILVTQLPKNEEQFSPADKLRELSESLSKEEIDKAKLWANEWMKTHQVRSYFLEFGM